MQFGLTNTPTSFQRFVNHVLQPILNSFINAYFTDILIFLDTIHKHRIEVKNILIALSKAGPHFKPEKCEFHRTEVAYMYIIVTNKGIKMDPQKVEPIV